MRSIAVVAMACRYPEARTPRQLWENVLAQRPAFRRLPAVRLRTDDYQGPEDTIRCDTAAVIENFAFDRAHYRVSAPAYRSVDLSHWVALEVAGELLEHLPHESLAQQTGVFVGNTLTSEFARANLMRLRWPYVERVLRTALQDNGPQTDTESLLLSVEDLYKSPFPPTSEESLAGGLSNTIAGRICNTFNFQGGGFTIDGACASSLLAVANACSSLENGSLDLAVAGGVDLSLDPFELAGFSALGALASQAMRVYDRRPTGFWPGEGCGFVALMREEEALARGIPTLARVRGWGISSDGHGSITRPEIAGQILALRRAYDLAGYAIETVPYFEGHGTGTAVGDLTELSTLKQARRTTANGSAAIGSIKTLIGHTKAAAGVASLIKAVCAVNSQVIPPTAGCEDPHPTVAEAGLRCPKRVELWPAGAELRAGVSAMGFGGINAHVAVEGTAAIRRARFNAAERPLLRNRQDCEVFPLTAGDRQELLERVLRLRSRADGFSFSELADCSAALAQRMDRAHDWRAAVVASSARELAMRLDGLATLLQSDTAAERIGTADGIYWSDRGAPARIGLLFPGQSSPVYRDGGLWARRFESVDKLYGNVRIPAGAESDTAVAQPAIAAASVAALSVLAGLGIEAEVALGHSLGELLALCWAGGITPEGALELAAERGRLMAEAGAANPGAMLSIAASRNEVERICVPLGVALACHNSRAQTVVSGPAASLDRLRDICAGMGIETTRLPVSCAFHSPLMAPAAEAFGAILKRSAMSAPKRRMISTVTGTPIGVDACVRQLLQQQITAPVEFDAAMRKARADVDVWFEAGPGHVLSSLAATTGVPSIALDSGGESVAGLCHAIAAAFVLKCNPNFDFWFRDRATRRFQFDADHTYLANPCESVPIVGSGRAPNSTAERLSDAVPEMTIGTPDAPDCLTTLRELVARRSELPLETIRPEHRFLSDLHLNSITVTQLIAQAARELGVGAPAMLVNYSTVTVAEAAAALEELRRHRGEDTRDGTQVGGVDAWVRPFAVDWVAKPATKQHRKSIPGRWRVLSDFAVEAGLAAKLAQLLEVESSGLLVYLANAVADSALPVLLSAAQEAAKGSVNRMVLLQEHSGAAPFFRSLFLENPKIDTTIITGTGGGSSEVERLAAEVLTTTGFREVAFDDNGVRRERRIRALPFPERRGFPLPPGSRLLVTGGGRGIGLECALELARRYRLKLAILGRSEMDATPELRSNLDRLRADAIEFRYLRADVADAFAVRDALKKSRIDGVIHAAGINIPERACSVTEEALRATLAPKRDGLRNVLAALEDCPPALVVTFGSVIAQTGLDGESHYALANEWMGRELESWARRNPESRALHLDWSVWAGAGMGERLGSLDAMVRRGIAPISIDSGVDGLDRMISGSSPGFESVILTGRFGTLPTLAAEEFELPLLRFLESQIVHVPGVELICDSVLTETTDPYFAEHEFDGQRLFPAVMGLEAMAQACCALERNLPLRAIEKVEFARPIVLPPDESRRIRVAALVRAPGTIEAVLRSNETGFQVDHFKATLVFGERSAPPVSTHRALAGEPVPLNPDRDLYGSILFHRGRFRRIDQYLALHALSCRSIVRSEPVAWFGGGMQQELLLGDPGARDAAIHSIQACIPHAVLLPVRVDRITMTNAAPATPGKLVVSATERSHRGDEYIYDLDVEDAAGMLIERWEGLALRKFTSARVDASLWPPALLVPYLEWAAAEFQVPVSVAVHASTDELRTERRRIVSESLAGPEAVHNRPDGKPETRNGTISFSHMEPFTIGVHAVGDVSCDMVNVQAIDAAEWRNLLGEELYSLAGLVSDNAREPAAYAAARVWAAFECLRKTGADPARRLTFVPERSNGWMVFSAGTKRVVVGMRRLSGVQGPVAVGILVDQQYVAAESAAG